MKVEACYEREENGRGSFSGCGGSAENTEEAGTGSIRISDVSIQSAGPPDWVSLSTHLSITQAVLSVMLLPSEIRRRLWISLGSC
jgi:hypothetical protein